MEMIANGLGKLGEEKDYTGAVQDMVKYLKSQNGTSTDTAVPDMKSLLPSQNEAGVTGMLKDYFPSAASPIEQTKATEQTKMSIPKAPNFSDINNKYQLMKYQQLAKLGSSGKMKAVLPMMDDYYKTKMDSEISQIKNDYINQIWQGIKNGQFSEQDAAILATQFENIGIKVGPGFVQAFKEPSTLHTEDTGKMLNVYSYDPRSKKMNLILSNPKTMTEYQERSIVNEERRTELYGQKTAASSAGGGGTQITPAERKLAREQYDTTIEKYNSASPSERQYMLRSPTFRNDLAYWGNLLGYSVEDVRSNLEFIDNGYKYPANNQPAAVPSVPGQEQQKGEGWLGQAISNLVEENKRKSANYSALDSYLQGY